MSGVGVSGERWRVVALAVVGSLVLGGCSVLREAEDRLETPAARPSPAPSVAEQKFATLAEYEAQTISWGGCEGFDPPEGATSDGFECGFVIVPLDYEDLTAGSLSVAVTRRPARGEKAGAILVNPGGPGASGIDYAFYDTFIISSTVVEEYDLVGFDPRGVARSQGIDCISDRRLDEYLAGDITPDTPQEELAYSDRLAQLAVGCGTQTPVAAHMDTVSAARDMDVLRAVLGEPSLNYLGKSYGTRLGAVYAELFPENVGRLVLDGAVDPDLDLAGGQAIIEQSAGFETAARSFVEDCQTRQDCPLTGDVDTGMSQIGAFMARLDVAPMPTGDEQRPLTQGLAVYGVFAPLYQVEAWELLRTGLTEAFDGSAETLLLLADLYSERADDGSYRFNTLEALSAVDCLDLPPRADREPSDSAETQREMEQAAPVFGEFFDVTYDTCEDWPFDGAGMPVIDAEGAAPILVIGTTRDPATPYAWAERLSGALESGVLVTFNADGHTAYLSSGSECVDDIVNQFFLAGTVPEDGVECVADYE